MGKGELVSKAVAGEGGLVSKAGELVLVMAMSELGTFHISLVSSSSITGDTMSSMLQLDGPTEMTTAWSLLVIVGTSSF